MSTSLLDNPSSDANEGASEGLNSSMQIGSLDGLEPPMFDETWDPAGSGESDKFQIFCTLGAKMSLRSRGSVYFRWHSSENKKPVYYVEYCK